MSMDVSLTPARPGSPPLRIHHLMACAVVAAVQLSLHRAVYPDSLSSASITTAILTTFSAIGLTLTLFLIYWRVIGRVSLTEPGQYLLLGRAITVVGFYLTIAAITWQRGGPVSSPSLGAAAMMFAANTAQFLVASLFFAWCAWRIADSRTWRLVFVIRAIAPLISSSILVSWLVNYARFQNLRLAIHGPAIGRSIAQLFVEIAAGVDDQRCARRRSWTHWAGLFLSIIGDVLSIVSGAIYFYWSTM